MNHHVSSRSNVHMGRTSNIGSLPGQNPMAPLTVAVTMPLSRLTAEDYDKDVYLLNQLDRVNDSPYEDGMPLRQWLIREAHLAHRKNPKLTEVFLRPRGDKSSGTNFCIQFDNDIDPR